LISKGCLALGVSTRIPETLIEELRGNLQTSAKLLKEFSKTT
jgi:arginine deiminase